MYDFDKICRTKVKITGKKIIIFFKNSLQSKICDFTQNFLFILFVF